MSSTSTTLAVTVGADQTSAQRGDRDAVADALDWLVRRTLTFDFTVWFWGDAIAIDGLLDAAEVLNSGEPLEYCRRVYERWGRRELTWVDHLAPGLGLLRVWEATQDDSLLDAARRLGEWLVNAVRKTASGLPLYRPDVPEYRYTVRVDSLYHTPPFLARLGEVTDDPAWIDAAVAVWHTHVEALTTNSGHILCHAYDAGHRAQRGWGWGRGNGWALLGTVDLLVLLPRTHPDYDRVLAWLGRLASELTVHQDASGFWHTLLDDREGYLDSSTAALFGTALGPEARNA